MQHGQEQSIPGMKAEITRGFLPHPAISPNPRLFLAGKLGESILKGG
jgi:hypothetical protein